MAGEMGTRAPMLLNLPLSTLNFFMAIQISSFVLNFNILPCHLKIIKEAIKIIPCLLTIEYSMRSLFVFANTTHLTLSLGP